MFRRVDGMQASTKLPPLRAVREAQGLGLREAARLAGINPAHLSQVEQGKAMLSLGALLRLARVLGLRELDRLLSQYVTEPDQ
jgi:transcriptional regulator with XRE-family HTH domain